jgi:hypothetical protein
MLLCITPRSPQFVSGALLRPSHTVQHRHSQHARTLTPVNTRTKSYPYEHLEGLSTGSSGDSQSHHAGASSSTGTSLTNQHITPENPGINLGKVANPGG